MFLFIKAFGIFFFDTWASFRSWKLCSEENWNSEILNLGHLTIRLKLTRFLKEEGPGRETWLLQGYSHIITTYLNPTRKPEKQDSNQNLSSPFFQWDPKSQHVQLLAQRRGLPSITSPVNGCEDLLLKYPEAASSKALNWVFQISLRMWGWWEFISLAMVWREKKSFLVGLGVKPKLGFPGECQGLHLLAHTQQESCLLASERAEETTRPSREACVAFILGGGKLPGAGWFCTFGD